MKFFLLLCLLCPLAAAQFDPTASNGPACASAGNPAYCTSAFSGLTTASGNTNAQTQLPVPPPGNISTVCLRTYLYPGSTTPIGLHYQPWFTPSNSHLSVGYDEKDPRTVTAQMLWDKSICVDFLSIDYYGNHSSKLKNLQVVQNVATVMAANPALYPAMMLGLDQGSWNSGAGSESGAHQCPANSTTAQMEVCWDDQFDYAAANYFYQPYYFLSGGRPLVSLFFDQNTWPSVNWAAVYAHIKAHTAAGQSCSNGGLYPGCTYTTSLKIIDRNSGSCADASLDGCYGWSPTQAWSNSSPSTQFDYDGTSGYLENLYATAQSNGKFVMGGIWAGFDNTPTSFGPPKMIAHQCGQPLILTAAKIAAAGYSSSNQLPALQFQTENDYEEGTVLETGVDNCFRVSASISGTNLNWTLTKTDSTYASLSTINNLQVLYCTSPTSCLVAPGLGNISPALSGTTSLLTVPAGIWQVYLQMVPKGWMLTRLSTPLNFSNIATASAPRLFVKVSQQIKKPRKIRG